jgi:sensor histidine kinase regulating citrate/malate metabolism
MKGGELLGTFLRPVYNENAQICAVSAIDISISSIRTATVKLLLNIALTIILIMIVSITVYHYVVSKQIIKPILIHLHQK